MKETIYKLIEFRSFYIKENLEIKIHNHIKMCELEPH